MRQPEATLRARPGRGSTGTGRDWQLAESWRQLPWRQCQLPAAEVASASEPLSETYGRTPRNVVAAAPGRASGGRGGPARVRAIAWSDRVRVVTAASGSLKFNFEVAVGAGQGTLS